MVEERRHSKRSRFDETEPRESLSHDDRKRSSRFDRRSRSPRQSRSRSPRLTQQSLQPKKPSADAAAAAAAAAARINAAIQAKKGLQQVDVPPILSALSQSSPPPPPPPTDTLPNLNGEVYVADGDYIQDIEVNDLRNRYTLTKGSTQKMIKDETGADVTTRGAYYPDKSLATAAKPPLYLHVTSTSKEGLEKAVQKIEDLMKQELPNLVDERRFRRREPDQVERDEFGRRKWPEEKIPINLDQIHGFNLRAQVVGQGGAYVKHIQQETGCRVQIKGRGSGFTERDTGQESDEPMYLHVAGPDQREVERARDLCLDLLGNVKEQYDAFKQNPPSQSYGGQGSRGGGSGYGNDSAMYSAYGAQAAAPSNPPGVSDASGQDPYAAYAQYYAANGQDPYAAYGGYQNYVAYYNYYAQQAQQPSATSPPPPNDSEAPPPPPPGAEEANGYEGVPPPPGL